MRVKFDHVLPSTFGIIKRDLTLHGTRVPLPFSARLSKVQMKMDMYLTIILFPCFDLVVYAPPVSWLIASVRHAGSRTFCLWSPWTLTLVRSNLGTWAWTPSWRGKKRSLAQSLNFWHTYLTWFVRGPNAQIRHPKRPGRLWVLGTSFFTNRYLLPGLQNFRKVLGSTLTIRPQKRRIWA